MSILMIVGTYVHIFMTFSVNQFSFWNKGTCQVEPIKLHKNPVYALAIGDGVKGFDVLQLNILFCSPLDQITIIVSRSGNEFSYVHIKCCIINNQNSWHRGMVAHWWSSVRKVAGSNPTSRHVGALGKSFTRSCLYDVMWLQLNSTPVITCYHPFIYYL